MLILTHTEVTNTMSNVYTTIDYKINIDIKIKVAIVVWF